MIDLRFPEEITDDIILSLIEECDRPTIASVAERVRFPAQRYHGTNAYALNVVRHIRRMIDDGLLEEDKTEAVPVLTKFDERNGEEVWENRTGLSGGLLKVAGQADSR